MKLLISNGSEQTTVGAFIERNKNEVSTVFKNELDHDHKARKQFINPFEMILLEIINYQLVITRLKRDINFEEIVYTGE